MPSGTGSPEGEDIWSARYADNLTVGLMSYLSLASVESKCPADMKRDKEQREARYRNFFQSRTSRSVPTGHFAQPPRPQYSVQSWITACESDALRRSKASCQSRV